MDLRAGDLLVAVDGRKVSSVTQTAKFINRAGDKFTLRIERRLCLNVPQVSYILNLKGGIFNILYFTHRRETKWSEAHNLTVVNIPVDKPDPSSSSQAVGP